MENYKKYPTGKDYYHIQYKPHQGMTGVGIVAGKHIRDGLYAYTIDIDIHRAEKREEALQRILKLTGSDVYIETTPSDGYHIIFYSRKFIEKKQNFDFSEENDCAKHRDGVEFGAGGNTHVIIAPSMARNKSGEIGQYEQISQRDLLNSAVLSEDQVNNLLQEFEDLSAEYRSKRFIHKHSTNQDHRDGQKWGRTKPCC